VPRYEHTFLKKSSWFYIFLENSSREILQENVGEKGWKWRERIESGVSMIWSNKERKKERKQGTSIIDTKWKYAITKDQDRE